jgi:hypothetical protein
MGKRTAADKSTHTLKRAEIGASFYIEKFRNTGEKIYRSKQHMIV